LDLSQYTAIFFNPKKNELLSSEYIRQALAMALDKQSIANDPNNFGSHVIDAPILPNIKTSPDIQKYGYNQQEAINLLEKNNWKLISSTTADGTTIQYRKKGQYDLSITITTVDKPENNKVVGLIKTAWEKIGFKVTINTIDKNRIRQDVINSRDYEALLFGENLGSDPDPYPFWHSSQVDPPGLNLAMYASKDVDKLIGDARKTADWQERQTKYWSFQTQITKDLPAIFLYAPTYTYPQDEQVKGFNVINITQPSDRFNNLSDWYIKTKRVWK
ncbi:MAG: ABC transporter substrate-binding protein, partial [bacterium]